MKNDIILNITKEMERNLTNFQLDKLKEILISNFKNIEILVKTSEYEKQIELEENNNYLNMFISSKEVEGCSKRTVKYYREIVERLIENINKNAKEITTDDIRKYLTDYKISSNCSAVTIDNIRRVFSSFFSWLEDEDYIIKSPVRRIRKIKTTKMVKETFTDECIEKMRDNCKDVRNLALIELLISTGMRVGELVNLKIQDINFEERSCVVLGKGNKEREVYFDARTKIHLLQYLNGRKDKNNNLFVSLKSPHQGLSISGVESIIRKLGLQSNINRSYPHKFRRTLATMAIDKGMPIEQVQKLLGHVKIETTMHYAMVNQTNVKLSHRKYIG
ncbi:MAG TPA: tyrosine-type recombinase/integrase [Gallicola sp.]|nr:tyrosine-type recombinase/integrase [Gallicola sp.]